MKLVPSPHLIAAALAILLPASMAHAGTSIVLTIINNSPQALQVGPLSNRSNWYPTDLANQPLVPANTSTVINTQMCSFTVFCWGDSEISFNLIQPGGGNEIDFYLTGTGADGPGWPGQITSTVAGLGSMYVVNDPQQSGQAALASASCLKATSYNTMNCTITLGPALFTTTNAQKYGTAEPQQNARNYNVGSQLMTDGLLLTPVAQSASQVQFVNGRLRYIASTMTLGAPSCGSVAGTILYTVMQDWTMYAMPVCNERAIVSLPVQYTRAYPSGSPVLQPIDQGKAAAVTIAQSSGLNITHGGLAAAQPVRSAGEMQVAVDGTVTAIDNNSGHYQPASYGLDAVVQHFRSLGAIGAFIGTPQDSGSTRTYR